MKKKLLTVVALIALVIVPSFAKSSDMSAGIALGTINGVGFKYHIDKDLTAGGTLGFDVLGGNSINIEGFGLYKAGELELDKLDFDLNVGLGASANIPLNNGDFSISALTMGEISYSFDSRDIPLDILLRVEPGLELTFIGSSVDPSFVIQASLQGLYRF